MCGVSVDPHLRLSGRVADPFPLRRMVSRGVLLWLGVLNPVAWVAGWVTVFVLVMVGGVMRWSGLRRIGIVWSG